MIGLLSLAGWLALWAEPTPPIQLHPGIRLIHHAQSEPRPLHWWCVNIAVDHPQLEWVVTPAGEVPAGYHTQAETTLAFAQRFGLIAAINASPFEPLAKQAGEPVRIDGLHLSAGRLVAPAKEHFGALLLGPGPRARIFSPPVPNAAMAEATHGVGGFSPLVRQGQNLFTGEEAKAARHPRTAVGLSEDGRVMTWIVVDGRQPRSLGVTQRELADLGIAAGCWTMLNLDGGGSSTLVVLYPTLREHRVVNSPVGKTLPGTLRLNGNHLGVRSRATPPPAP